MNRQEHLEWAKNRAFEVMEKYSSFGAWVAFKHDLHKHEELRDHVAIELYDQMLSMMVLPALRAGNVDALLILDGPGLLNTRSFIKGFQ